MPKKYHVGYTYFYFIISYKTVECKMQTSTLLYTIWLLLTVTGNSNNLFLFIFYSDSGIFSDDLDTTVFPKFTECTNNFAINETAKRIN